MSGKFWLYTTVPLALPSCLLHARSFTASPVPSHAGLLCATPTLLYDCFQHWAQTYFGLYAWDSLETTDRCIVAITTVCLPLVFRPVGWTLGLMNWRMPPCRHIIPLFRNYLVNHAHMILTSWVQTYMTVCRVIPDLVLAQNSYPSTMHHAGTSPERFHQRQKTPVYRIVSTRKQHGVRDCMSSCESHFLVTPRVYAQRRVKAVSFVCHSICQSIIAL